MKNNNIPFGTCCVINMDNIDKLICNALAGDITELDNWLLFNSDGHIFNKLLYHANEKNNYAQYLVGKCYYMENPVNEKAFGWLRASADQGNSNAFYLLGIMYRYGMGIGKNMEKAFECYKASANKNNINGQMGLADMYNYGYGTKKNYLEAIRLYKLCYNKNNSWAAYYLSEIYYNAAITQPVILELLKNINANKCLIEEKNNYAVHLLYTPEMPDLKKEKIEKSS